MRRSIGGSMGLATAIWAALAFWVALDSPSARAASSNPIINQIEVDGVKAFGEADITELVEVSAGDRLDREKAVNTANSMRNLYLQRGYRDAHITVRILKTPRADGTEQNVLHYQVDEGLPTRLGHVILDVRDTIDLEADSRLAKALKDIGEDLGDPPGKILSEDALNEVLQSVQERLATKGYLGGSQGQPTLEDTISPPNGEPGRYVNFKVSVDPGDRVRFGFEGNEVLSVGQLQDLVSGLQEIGLGKDYVEVIRNRVLQEYLSLGYADAKVTVATYSDTPRPKVCGYGNDDGGGLSQPAATGSIQDMARCAARPGRERAVTFHIHEGPRVRIHSVAFDGNTHFEAGELLDQFEAGASQRVRRGIYVEDDVEKGAQVLVDWVKSKGYLSAKLVTINRGKALPGNQVPLTVYLYEGEQTLVRQVDYQGIKAFEPEEVNRFLSLEARAPLNLYAFTSGIEALKTAYRRRGYMDVAVTNEGSDSVIRYFEKNRYADIHLVVQEGPQFKVSTIEVEGLQKTEKEVVLRELAFKEGGPIDEERVTTSESRLRRLGIFSAVRVLHRTDLKQTDHKQVKIEVAEVTPGYYGAGVGFRNDLGVRVFGEVGYANIGGRNQSWFLGGNANRRLEDFRYVEYQLQVGYVWPWFLGVPELTFRPELTRERRQYVNFDADSSLFTATWERSLWDRWGLLAGLTYSLEFTRQFHAVDPTDNVNLTIGALIPSLTVDLRDNPLSPTKGFFAKTSFELASTAFLSQSEPFPVSYTRLQGRTDYTAPLGEGASWYFSLRGGLGANLADPHKSDGSIDTRVQIPLIKQFSLGGVQSMRGYKLQELNIQAFAIQGTMAYVNYRTQIDIPLAGNLRFGPFLDSGVLLVDGRLPQPRVNGVGALLPKLGVRYGTGLGLHYQTPVGPVNLDLGFKVAPLPGEDREEFHFSVGVL